MILTDDDPPVSVTTEGWNGLGKWAFCTMDGTIHSAGFGISAGEPSGMHYASSFVKQELGWQLPPPVSIDWKGKAGWWSPDKHKCAIMDLNNASLKSVPAAVNFCVSQGSYLVLVESNGRWMSVTTVREHPHPFVQVRLSKRKHGWYYVYNSTTDDIFSVTYPNYLPQSSSPAQLHSVTEICHMTRFSEDRPKATMLYVMVTIEDPVVIVTRALGVAPQFVSLLSGAGGIFTVLGLIFTTVFIKKYPDAEVTLVYEARTLIGFQDMGMASQRSRSGNEGWQARQMAPQKETARLQQRRPSGVPPPPHPPGVRRFSKTPAVV